MVKQDLPFVNPCWLDLIPRLTCMSRVISFYDPVTRLVDEGKAVDVVYLDFSKAFDTVQATDCQLLEENTVGDSVKGFAEV